MKRISILGSTGSIGINALSVINKLKPSSAKGTYVKSLTVSSTQSPGVKIDTKSFN